MESGRDIEDKRKEISSHDLSRSATYPAMPLPLSPLHIIQEEKKNSDSDSESEPDSKGSPRHSEKFYSLTRRSVK